jgi:hypothetical protein
MDAMTSDVSHRVQKHRAGLRASGLRPVQIWVPDTRRPGFAEECRRQSRLLRADPDEQDILQFIAGVPDTDDWE